MGGGGGWHPVHEERQEGGRVGQTKKQKTMKEERSNTRWFYLNRLKGFLLPS